MAIIGLFISENGHALLRPKKRRKRPNTASSSSLITQTVSPRSQRNIVISSQERSCIKGDNNGAISQSFLRTISDGISISKSRDQSTYFLRAHEYLSSCMSLKFTLEKSSKDNHYFIKARNDFKFNANNTDLGESFKNASDDDKYLGCLRKEGLLIKDEDESEQIDWEKVENSKLTIAQTEFSFPVDQKGANSAKIFFTTPLEIYILIKIIEFHSLSIKIVSLLKILEEGKSNLFYGLVHGINLKRR